MKIADSTADSSPSRGSADRQPPTSSATDSSPSLGSADRWPSTSLPAQDASDDAEEVAADVDPDDLTLLDLVADHKPTISSLTSNEDAVAYVDLMDALQLLGVDCVDAARIR